jgi:hypothetical protein
MNRNISRFLKSLLVVSLVLITQTAKSQTDSTKVLADSLLGTWAGSFNRLSDYVENRRQTPIMWRIHKIDIGKKEIELTEIGQRLFDGSIIDNPEKSTYTGFFKDSCLVIEFDKQKKDKNMTLTLRIKRLDRMLVLQEISAPDKNTGRSTLICMLGKISSDSSKYQKPKKGEVEVVITAPPALKE